MQPAPGRDGLFPRRFSDQLDDHPGRSLRGRGFRRGSVELAERLRHGRHSTTKESEFGGSPWEPASNQLMRSLSPITYAGNVKTPTLFLDGESDMRVPIMENEQLYTALKKLRVPAKMVRYPGDYHGGWPAWDMVHRYYQETQRFREFLQ